MVDYYAHETSIIEDGCKIGKGSKIWHFSHIMPKVEIGEDCNIGQNVFIANNVLVGDRVKIQNNVSLYDGVQVEEDVFLGPSCVFTNVRNPRSFISQKDKYQNTLIKKGATIGANATIVCGVTIGEYAFIGAGAVVTQNIPNYALAYGNPARIRGRVNEEGIISNPKW